MTSNRSNDSPLQHSLDLCFNFVLLEVGVTVGSHIDKLRIRELDGMIGATRWRQGSWSLK